MNLFHTFVQISRLTDIKNYNKFFGVLFLNAEYFLLLSLNVIIYEDCMLFKLSVFKCKTYKVYLKYTCKSSTLAQSKILKYILN